jgi:hypothetical protein
MYQYTRESALKHVQLDDDVISEIALQNQIVFSAFYRTCSHVRSKLHQLLPLAIEKFSVPHPRLRGIIIHPNGLNYGVQIMENDKFVRIAYTQASLVIRKLDYNRKYQTLQFYSPSEEYSWKINNEITLLNVIVNKSKYGHYDKYKCSGESKWRHTFHFPGGTSGGMVSNNLPSEYRKRATGRLHEVKSLLVVYSDKIPLLL